MALIIFLWLVYILLSALLQWILLQLKFALCPLTQGLVELCWKLPFIFLLFFFTHFLSLIDCFWLHVNIFVQFDRGFLMVFCFSFGSLKEAGHSRRQFNLAKLARKRLIGPHLTFAAKIVEEGVDPIKCRLLITLGLNDIGHIFGLNLLSKLPVLPLQQLYLVCKLKVSAIIKRQSSLQLCHLSILLIIASQLGLVVRNRSQVDAFHHPSIILIINRILAIYSFPKTRKSQKQRAIQTFLFDIYRAEQLSILKMNITPTKKEGSNRKDIKKTGERVAAEEQPEEQVKGSKMSIKTMVIIAVCSILIIAAIIIPIVLLVRQSNAVEVVYLDKGLMQVPTKSGGTFESQPISVTKNDKKVILTKNKVRRTARMTQEGPAQSGSISYYHKDTQISVTIESQNKAQIRIPGDTGLDFLLNSAPVDSQSTLERLPEELPKALQKEIQEKTGLKMTVTTEISYDGVFDPNTNEYRLLTQQKSYHPEQFAKISPEERDLCDPKPEIKNFNDISDVTGSIAKAVSAIAVNTMSILSDSQLKPEAGAKAGPEVTRCVRVGEEVLRCSDEVWRSGELKVSNLQDPNPLEVWEIVMTTQ